MASLKPSNTNWQFIMEQSLLQRGLIQIPVMGNLFQDLQFAFPRL